MPSPPLDARMLTREIIAGNTDAFAALYEAKFDMLYTAIKHSTGFDESRSLDIVQDAMLRAIRKMKPIDTTAELDAWLLRVARTTALDSLRQERRRRARERGAAQGLVRTDSSNSRTNASVSRTQVDDLEGRSAWLVRTMSGLDRTSVELLELRFRAGLTLEETGRRLGIKPGAVHGRLARLLTRLRAQAEKEESHDA